MIRRWRQRRRIVHAARELVATGFAQDFRHVSRKLESLCQAVEGT